MDMATTPAPWQSSLDLRKASSVSPLQGAVWLNVDKLFEGPILIRFGHDHAPVLPDLLGLAAMFGAAVCVLGTGAHDRTRWIQCAHWCHLR